MVLTYHPHAAISDTPLPLDNLMRERDMQFIAFHFAFSGPLFTGLLTTTIAPLLFVSKACSLTLNAWLLKMGNALASVFES